MKCQTKSGPYQCASTLDKAGKHGGPCETQAPEYARTTVFVAKNGYWFELCKEHGLTEHYAAIGGRCGQCKKAEEAKS
jgi:hypothetical protein